MSGKKIYMKLLQKRFLRIIILMSLLIVVMFSAILVVMDYNNKRSRFMDLVQEEKIIFEILSRSATAKYALHQSLRYGSFLLNEVEIREAIERNRTAIKTHQRDFEANLEKILSQVEEKGVFSRLFFNQTIQQGAIEIANEIDLTWNEYKKLFQVIVDTDEASLETEQSLVYIRNHSRQLMNDLGELTSYLLSYEKRISLFTTGIILLLFLAALILLVVSISQLNKYLVLPLNQLYEGLKGMKTGQINLNIKTNKQGELGSVIQDVEESFEKVDLMVSLIKNINESLSFQGILEYIFYSFSPFMPYSHIGIALLKDQSTTIEGTYTISSPELKKMPTALSGLRVDISGTSLGKIIESGTPRIINDLKAYTKGSQNKEYNQILLEAGIQSSITFPLKIRGNPIGVIFFSSMQKNAYNDEHVIFLQAISESIAISLNINIFIDDLLYSSILALAKMADARDDDTGEHINRMKSYSIKIIEFLLADQKFIGELTPEFIKDVERFSPMHDIGKVGIRDGILLKPSKLTEEEFAEMKRHTIYGADVLLAAESNINKHGKSLFKVGIDIAKSHHEKWNGTGYPFGKKGEEIPLSARIVAIADVFDALTSKRVYKPAFPFEDCLKILLEESGKHFDPSIIESVLRHQSELYQLYLECHKEYEIY